MDSINYDSSILGHAGFRSVSGRMGRWRIVRVCVHGAALLSPQTPYSVHVEPEVSPRQCITGACDHCV